MQFILSNNIDWKREEKEFLPLEHIIVSAPVLVPIEYTHLLFHRSKTAQKEKCDDSKKRAVFYQKCS